jgi:hypothetical protein
MFTTPPQDCSFQRSSAGRTAVRRALLETEAVLGLLHHVRGEPVRIVGVGKISPHEWATAFLALKRGMNDQLARIDHVHGIDRVEPLVVDVSCGPFDPHAGQ